MLRFALLLTSLAAIPNASLACTPVPEPHATKLFDQVAANVDRRATSMFEAVVIKPAEFPRTGALKVSRVYWGNIRKGDLIPAKPSPVATCGMYPLVAGARGTLLIYDRNPKIRTYRFQGFLSEQQLAPFRRRGLLRP